jgi:hypothetical protein
MHAPMERANSVKSFEIWKLQTPIAVMRYSPSKRKDFVTYLGTGKSIQTVG